MQKTTEELLGLRALLDNVGAHIFTKDLQGRYTYVNRLCAEMWQLAPEQCVGRFDNELFDAESTRKLRENDLKVITSGIAQENEESNVIKATGATRIYLVVKAPIRDEAGDIIGICGVATDITERKRLEVALAQQSNLLNTVLHNIEANIYLKDHEGRYVYVNPRVANLLKLPTSEIIGRTDVELLPGNIGAEYYSNDQKVFETGTKMTMEEPFIDKDGNTRYYWSTKMPLQLPGQPEMLIGFSTDVTEQRALRMELERRANTDALTGIYNRLFFYQVAEQEFLRSRRYGTSMSLLIIDIDHFKSINDTYGHHAGDVVLQAMAGHCQRSVRDCDTLARVGGEEFAVLMPETAQADALIMAARLCSSFEGLLMTMEPKDISVTISAGISEFRASDTNLQSIFTRADRALYQAKRLGRNQVCVDE
ncbi:MAG: diguanylate cyclase, partial [Gammaproteobacteria bacterium]|nr:diguanylate cyclase [Gammaproteobacteria bacterium]